MKMTPKESPLKESFKESLKETYRAGDRPFAEPTEVESRQPLGDRVLRPRPFTAAPAARLALSHDLTPAMQFKRPAQNAAQSPYLVHWLQSGGNLDFCVLALCSCVLSVLCHQTAVPSSPMASATGTAPTSAVQPAQIAFALKAGLFTTSPKIEEESESD